eukprot:987643-Pleurochrysis_carterae.AAC.1
MVPLTDSSCAGGDYSWHPCRPLSRQPMTKEYLQAAATLWAAAVVCWLLRTRVAALAGRVAVREGSAARASA